MMVEPFILARKRVIAVLDKFLRMAEVLNSLFETQMEMGFYWNDHACVV
jgi:hypothetical protein